MLGGEGCGSGIQLGNSENPLLSLLCLSLAYWKTHYPAPITFPLSSEGRPSPSTLSHFHSPVSLGLPALPVFVTYFSPPGPCWGAAGSRGQKMAPATPAGGTTILSVGQERESSERNVYFSRDFKMLAGVLTLEVTKNDLGCQMRRAGRKQRRAGGRNVQRESNLQSLGESIGQ